MSLKSKTTRSQIADLPEVEVELTDDELRIVSGALKASGFTCYTQFKVSRLNATNIITNGDWDTD